MASTETVQPPAPPRRRTRRGIALDVVVLVGIVALVAFAGAARLAADRLPRAAASPLRPLPAGLAHPKLRDVPVGLRAGDLPRAATALPRNPRARRLLPILRNGTPRPARPAPYPYRYRALEDVLPKRFAPSQVVAATDLGAKLILLDRAGRGSVWGAPAAYAVLDRARAGGACDPSLDLLLLVAAATDTTPRIIAGEAARARRACPGDPTPGWLFAQYQSSSGLPLSAGEAADLRPAARTFAQLAHDMPGAAAAWSGQADALVREALATAP